MMDAEPKINAFRFCLQCPCWKTMSISESGWWTPRGCDYWNSSKGTIEKPYGPMNGCKYKLEHYLLDNRLGFKLVSGETYMPLIEFMEKYLNLRWCSEEKREFKAFFVNSRKRKDLYIERREVEQTDIIIEDVVCWINKILQKNGYRKLIHNYKYDRIQKTRGEQWESVQIEKSEERN